MLGLKRGTVKLCDHEKEWEIQAENTVKILKSILGDTACDIQHIGSTAVSSIKAKPIIDIVVATDSFEKVLSYETNLREEGFYYRPNVHLGEQLLFAKGSYYDGTGDMQTHFIHVVHTNSSDYVNYINFRDYLNENPETAKEYEKIKLSLEKSFPTDDSRQKYTAGKQEFISFVLRKALVKSYLGKTVDIVIDRPKFSSHPKYPSLVYPVNYGYIPNVLGGDGEELDVYLLGVEEPVTQYRAEIIGIVHRENDNEDKLIAAPEKCEFSKEDIINSVHFQEKYFISEIELL